MLFFRDNSELEARLRELAPMVEAMHATEGQLPPEKTELLLKRIAEGAAKRRFQQARHETLWKELASAIAEVPVELRKKWTKLPELLSKIPYQQIRWPHDQGYFAARAEPSYLAAAPAMLDEGVAIAPMPEEPLESEEVELEVKDQELQVKEGSEASWDSLPVGLELEGQVIEINVDRKGGVFLDRGVLSKLMDAPDAVEKIQEAIAEGKSHFEREEMEREKRRNIEKANQELSQLLRGTGLEGLLGVQRIGFLHWEFNNTTDARQRWEALLEIGEPSESSDSKLEEKVDLPIEHQEIAREAKDAFSRSQEAMAKVVSATQTFEGAGLNEDFNNLITALRDELTQYGEVLALMQEQQQFIINRSANELLLNLNEVNEQMKKIECARDQREACRRALVATLGATEEMTFRQMTEMLPTEVQPLLIALVDEINQLLQRIPIWLRQNHMLLTHSMDLMKQIMQGMFPRSSTGTYGRKAQPIPEHNRLFEAI